MWPLGPAGFPEGSGEKSSSSHIDWQIDEACESNSSLPCPSLEGYSPPGMETTPGKHGEWRRRAGGASAACLRSV